MGLGVLTGISAGASVLGGIFGSRSASRANRAAQKAYEEQKKLLRNKLKRLTSIMLKSLQLIKKTILIIASTSGKLA